MTGFYQSQEWRKLRAKAVKQSGYQCAVCGASIRGKGKARVDHIKTVKQFPHLALDPSNLRCLCTSCDAARHSEKGRNGIEKETINAEGYPEAWT